MLSDGVPRDPSFRGFLTTLPANTGGDEAASEGIRRGRYWSGGGLESTQACVEIRATQGPGQAEVGQETWPQRLRWGRGASHRRYQKVARSVALPGPAGRLGKAMPPSPVPVLWAPRFQAPRTQGHGAPAVPLGPARLWGKPGLLCGFRICCRSCRVSQASAWGPRGGLVGACAPAPPADGRASPLAGAPRTAPTAPTPSPRLASSASSSAPSSS